MPMSPPAQVDPSNAFGYRGWSLFEAMDALIAYDEGATDSGVADEAMRRAVKDHLDAMDDDQFRRTCAEFARSCYLGDEPLARGYGLKEVRDFLDWLSRLGFDI